MKKKFFLLSAAAAMVTAATAFTSCSNDELEGAGISGFNSSRDVISFTTQRGTRAGGETVDSLHEFTVTALNDNDNTDFFRDKVFKFQNGYFVSDINYYWPHENSLSFYACNFDGEGTEIKGDNNVPQYSFTDWAAEKDLVAASKINLGSGTGTVRLNFKHITSKVITSISTENLYSGIDDVTYEITSLKVNAPSAGTFSFANTTDDVGTWSIDKYSCTNYDLIDGQKISLMGGKKIDSTAIWNLLPVKNGTLTFTVEYKVYINSKLYADYTGDNCKVCTAKNTNFNAGNIYKYDIHLTHDASKINLTFSSINRWDYDAHNNNQSSLTLKNNTCDRKTVNLGLPSGLLWTKGNIGANKETDEGLFFAWGETIGYSYHNSSHHFLPDNYQASEISANLTLEQDAAYAYNNGKFRIPTQAEAEELLNNCDKQYVKNYNNSNVNGFLLTSKTNGNTIFFPSTGYQKDEVTIGSSVCIWLSTYSDSDNARYLFFDKNNQFCINSNYRYYGMSVRAVCE